jgi:hypothetical protein
MKSVTVKFMVAALMMSSVLFSCKKEDVKEETCSISMQGLSGSYGLRTFKYKMSATAPEQDFLFTLDECEKDDIVKLHANGTSESTDMGIICSPNNSDSGTWSLSGNTIIADGLINGTIGSYDCKTLVIYLDNIFVPGDRYIITFEKK